MVYAGDDVALATLKAFTKFRFVGLTELVTIADKNLGLMTVPVASIVSLPIVI
jgi:hypothetical protein